MPGPGLEEARHTKGHPWGGPSAELRYVDLACLVVVVPVCIGAVAQGDEGGNENGKGKDGNFSREIHGVSPYWVKG